MLFVLFRETLGRNDSIHLLVPTWIASQLRNLLCQRRQRRTLPSRYIQFLRHLAQVRTILVRHHAKSQLEHHARHRVILGEHVGFDTLDANLQLGFDDDERLYQPAAQMLRLLDIAAVRLMTNNPFKVDALARHGIAVAERVPHVFPANDHNEGYLRTKATRGGHLF